MKNMKKTSLTVFVVSFINVGLFAQTIFDEIATNDELNTISTSVPFLLIAPDSRAGAMGDVGAATSPDHNSIHWNASKFAFIVFLELLMSITKNTIKATKRIAPSKAESSSSFFKK